MCAEPAAGIYPVGGPEVIRLARLVEVLERIIGTPAVIRIVESKAVEPALVDLDNTRVRDQFSWSPEVAIEAGAAAVVDDIRLRFFTDRNAATVE